MPPAFAQVLLDGPLAGSYAYRIPAASTSRPASGRSCRGASRAASGSSSRSPTPATSPRRSCATIEQLLPELPPLAPQWLDFIRFAAGYYQGEAAELGLGSVPKLLRVPPSPRTRKRADARLAAFDPAPSTALALGR